ncbi:MAG: carbohydrate ABC transporter permease, partial [Planctomycetaceae bacterium]
MAIYMSFTDWPLIGTPELVGFAQYQAIPNNDLLMSSIPFTIAYTVVATVVFFVVSLCLALFVQDTKRGVGFFRTAFFIPSVVGVTSAALLFYAMYNNEYGPIDDLLRAIGLAEGNVDFLATQQSAFASTLVMTTWRYAGFNMLLLLTGLQAIPKELYEAAAVDGASRWQSFVRVTLPLMR